MIAGPQSRHARVRPDWLMLHSELALDPGQAIIDAHHHLYDRPGQRYLLDDLLDDLRGGHSVRATVYVQGRAMLRADGPEALRPVGETEFANGIAAMSASGIYGPVRVCDAIVGFADLRLGAKVRPVLEGHIAAGGGRFRGIRQIVLWDKDASLTNPAYEPREDMLDSPIFRAGFAELGPLDLSFDAWLLFHQLPRLIRLARDFPATRIVLNHCGGIARIGPYAGRDDEVFALWSRYLAELAECDNVTVKISGLGMPLAGFGFHQQALPPTSQVLATAWRPWIETVLATFGPERCMVGSNFPVDKGGHSYAVGWNALQRLAEPLEPRERDDLFWRTATRVYRLSPIVQDSAVGKPATDNLRAVARSESAGGGGQRSETGRD